MTNLGMKSLKLSTAKLSKWQERYCGAIAEGTIPLTEATEPEAGAWLCAPTKTHL